MWLTIKESALLLDMRLIYSCCNPVPTELSIFVNFTSVVVFFAIFIDPIIVSDYLAWDEIVAKLTEIQFPLLSHLIKPIREIYTDIKAIFICIILICFAPCYVLVDFILHFQMIQYKYIQARICIAQIIHFLF